MKRIFGTTTGTDSRLFAKMVHTFCIDGISGSFFKKKLAIDQILSYHNSAIKPCCFLKIRAMTLQGAWRCMEGERYLFGNAFSLFIVNKVTIPVVLHDCKIFIFLYKFVYVCSFFLWYIQQFIDGFQFTFSIFFWVNVQTIIVYIIG